MFRIFRYIIILALLIPALAYGAVNQLEETDGSPTMFPWKIKVPAGSMTNNGDGTASLSWLVSFTESDPLSWLSASNQTGLTGDKTGQFNLNIGTGTLGAGATTLDYLGLGIAADSSVNALIESAGKVPLVMNPQALDFGLLIGKILNYPGALWVSPLYESDVVPPYNFFFYNGRSFANLSLFTQTSTGVSSVTSSYYYSNFRQYLGIGYNVESEDTVGGILAIADLTTQTGTISCNTGTVSVDTGVDPLVVNGSGTSFLSEFSAGDTILVVDTGESDVIATVDNDTQLTLVNGLGSDASGSAYTGSRGVVGSGTTFTTQYAVGDMIFVLGQATKTITDINDDTHLKTDASWETTFTGSSIYRKFGGTAFSVNEGNVGVGIDPSANSCKFTVYGGDQCTIDPAELGPEKVTNGDFDPSGSWTVTSGWAEGYVFTVSGVTTAPAVNQTYTNNGVTFTVRYTQITGTSSFL